MATPLSRYSPQDDIDALSKVLSVDESSIQNFARQASERGNDAMAININSGYQQPSVQQNMASLEAAMLMQNAQQNPDQYGGNVANKLMQEKALRLEDDAQQSQSMAEQEQAMMQQQQVEQAEMQRRQEYVQNVAPLIASRFPDMSEEEVFSTALQAAAQDLPLDKLFPDESSSFETLSPQEAAQMGLNPEGSYQREAGTGKVSAIGGGGVTVNTGDRMPPDMIQGPDGSWIPREGSDTAYKREQDALKQAQSEAKLDKASVAKATGTERAGLTVIQDMNRAKSLIGDMIPGTGVVGANARLASAKIPGTGEFYANQFIESAKSNIGLDRLQQMRDSSPTGGALGQVPIQQQKRLEQVLGNIDVSMPPAMMTDNIDRINNIYFDIIYGSPAERALAIEQGEMSPEESAEIDGMQQELSFDKIGMPKKQGSRFKVKVVN